MAMAECDASRLERRTLVVLVFLNCKGDAVELDAFALFPTLSSQNLLPVIAPTIRRVVFATLPKTMDGNLEPLEKVLGSHFRVMTTNSPVLYRSSSISKRKANGELMSSVALYLAWWAFQNNLRAASLSEDSGKNGEAASLYHGYARCATIIIIA